MLSKYVALATILLVALLMVFAQPRSGSVTAPADAENSLSFQQGLDKAISFGLVHDDTQFVTAFLLAAALLLSIFLVKAASSISSTSTTTILSRNSCCIVPKGP